ncbi:MAG: oligosaccharide flippase family protein [Bacteroides sp.]|nr:oligosaccharide flippase family protein [Bacteroides sp.]
MGAIKSLAKDTMVYGLSSIVGRFLNWLLVPLYTNIFSESQYGVVTYIYAITALVLLILIYGMETGFFRFANHDRYKDPLEVYSTTLISLAVTSSVFFIGVMCFLPQVSDALHCAGHPSYIWLMAAVLALDAFTAIPFCYLRYRHRPLRFASLKLVSIALNIGSNLFFLLLCPWLQKQFPDMMTWFDMSYGVGYVFLSNFISSVVVMLLLIPDLRGFRWRFNLQLWREMVVYSFPLLILGIAGIMNQTIDKILLPQLVADKAEAMAEVGIYGANQKIAIVMVMFIQAFRFAYEPFIFAQNKQKGASKLHAYSEAMKYFVIFSMIIFLAVMFYLPIIRHLIAPDYYSGLKVVPIVMIAEFFFGVFFNLSLWYKITDKTVWGTWFSLLGLVVTLSLNFLLVPRMGYMGCAIASLCCYGVMMVASWAVGRVKHPIPYPTARLVAYFISTMLLYGLSLLIATGNEWIDMGIRTVILVIFLFAVARIEHLSIRTFIPRR